MMAEAAVRSDEEIVRDVHTSQESIHADSFSEEVDDYDGEEVPEEKVQEATANVLEPQEGLDDEGIKLILSHSFGSYEKEEELQSSFIYASDFIKVQQPNASCESLQPCGSSNSPANESMTDGVEAKDLKRKY